MCETQRPTAKPKSTKLEDIFPMKTLEDRAVVWGVSTAAQVREENPILQAFESELDGKIKSAILAIMQLADPKVSGSDDLLQAIIERRREKMH